MKIKMFIDFDNTLFDTRKLKKDLFAVFSRYGFKEEEISSTYKKACEDYIYSPSEHADELYKIKPFDKKNAESELDELYKNIPEYLFNDSIDFLKNLDKDKFEINLLTLGDLDFQKKKVDFSNISKYFENIYYCKDQKWIFLKTLVEPNEKFYIIDDRGDALFEISKDFKLSSTIEINRASKPLDNMEQPAPYEGIKVKNFAEAMPYLK